MPRHVQIVKVVHVHLLGQPLQKIVLDLHQKKVVEARRKRKRKRKRRKEKRTKVVAAAVKAVAAAIAVVATIVQMMSNRIYACVKLKMRYLDLSSKIVFFLFNLYIMVKI